MLLCSYWQLVKRCLQRFELSTKHWWNFSVSSQKKTLEFSILSPKARELAFQGNKELMLLPAASQPDIEFFPRCCQESSNLTHTHTTCKITARDSHPRPEWNAYMLAKICVIVPKRKTNQHQQHNSYTDKSPTGALCGTSIQSISHDNPCIKVCSTKQTPQRGTTTPQNQAIAA